MSTKPVIGDCKFCGQRKKLCKAHIIPRQYYRRIMRGKHDKLYLLNHERGEFEKPQQTGPYDSKILCAQCDNILGGYDDYGYRVLSAKIDENRIRRVARMHEVGYGPLAGTVYIIGLIDVVRFKLFLASLAWRAAITTNPMFGAVRLGSYRDRLKNVLLGTDTETMKHVGAFLTLFCPAEFSDAIWQPSRLRFGEASARVNCILFYLPPWKIYIKLDRRPFCSPFDEIAIAEGRTVEALVQDSHSPAEVKRLKAVQASIRAADEKLRAKQKPLPVKAGAVSVTQG